MDTSKKQRAGPRTDLALRAVYQGAEDYLTAWTTNISAGGLFISTEERREIGDPLQVTLSFPGLLAEVVVQGTVAWVRPAGAEEPAGLGLTVQDDASLQRMARVALQTSDTLYAAVDRPGVYRVAILEAAGPAQNACRRVLEDLGDIAAEAIEVVFCNSANEALHEISRRPADLLITDIDPPKGGGPALCAELRQQPASEGMQLLVIATGDDPRREDMRRMGVGDFVDKPIVIGRLLQTIVYLIHLRDLGAAAGG